MSTLDLPVTLRLMTEDDFPRLHDWLNRPHVLAWWGGEQQSLEAVREKYRPRVRGHEAVTPYIALLGDEPFGFAQSYVAMGSGDGWWEDETDPGVRGIDQSIGDPRLLDKGLGARLVRALTARLFEDSSVTRIQVDPATTNARAIRCYEKAGFEHVGIVATPDGPAAYMLKARDLSRLP
jgi:aminoglycoside 6'-N-acetyltransferase-1b/aminoglycoside 6'-N-acetyltransferase-2